MSEKKGFFSGLFGGKKSGGCCNMEIVEEPSCDCGCGCAPQQESVGCDCGGACEPQSAAESILILGPGCKNCQALEANTRTALEQMGDTTSTIGHVTDFAEIAKYGVMSTPGLVVDGTVVSYGKVLKPEDIVTILKKVRG